MEEETTFGARTLATGVFVGIVSAVATFSGVQTWYAPMPTLVLVPALFVGPGAAIVAILAFYVWNYQLFLGRAAIPIRSFVLFVVAANLSFWTIGYELFQQRQISHNAFLAIMNALFVAALWLLFRAGKENPSPSASWRFHAILFVYLFSYCFPYTGELP